MARRKKEQFFLTKVEAEKEARWLRKKFPNNKFTVQSEKITVYEITSTLKKK